MRGGDLWDIQKKYDSEIKEKSLKNVKMFTFFVLFGLKKKEATDCIVELKQCLFDKSTFICSSFICSSFDFSPMKHEGKAITHSYISYILRKAKYIYSDIYYKIHSKCQLVEVSFVMESEADSDCYDYERCFCDNLKYPCSYYYKETEKDVENAELYLIHSIACKEKQNGEKQDENRYL